MQGIRIGPAGWSYKDWNGIVYPRSPGAEFDPLAYLARFFDTIEINSSFYRPPTAETAQSWAARVAQNPNFRFTAKLHKLFTHSRGKATANDEKDFRLGIDPLAEAGKLGAILIQFPWSFKNEMEERQYLVQLLERFKDYPRVVELRHASWNSATIYQTLEDLGVGFCNIDQPLFAKSIKPSATSTSMVGYVRLHGRNYQNWFREEAGPEERYDYLYSPDELEPWIARIKEIAKQTKETYVITNNHFRGQAVTNALEVKAVIEEERVPGPAPLLELYPRLIESIVPEAANDQPTLF
ncbi:MAG TPA: DUF72 domain-containing protein [Pyrinomonadaceae bacterium]|jgi:uncharacterized protein YecE (DUF72 family)